MAIPRQRLYVTYDTTGPEPKEYEVYTTVSVWTDCSDGDSYDALAHRTEDLEFTKTKVIHVRNDKSDTNEVYRVHDGAWEKAAVKPAKRVAQAGRNDPCPCGSNNKYKRCCGK